VKTFPRDVIDERSELFNTYIPVALRTDAARPLTAVVVVDMMNEIVCGVSVKVNVDTYLNIYVAVFVCMSGVYV
jgi:hypothetical protein